MTPLEQIIVILYGLQNLLAFRKGFYEIKDKNNAYGLAKHFGLLGIFVWGDALIIGPFWLIICSVILFLQDWYLFLVVFSIFWAVRSLGEIIYWLNEQFAGKNRNPPQTLKFYYFIKSDAIWFIYQLFWQCILVISIIASIYFSSLWLQSKF
jgi:hypothetical protein